MMGRAHVEVSGLRIVVAGAERQEQAIVDDISFSIPRGEVLALIGESGSGKTTIALAMMGYSRFGARIAGGEIRVGNYAIDRLDQVALTGLRGRHIAYVAQSAAAAFNPSRTIMAQVIEPLLVHGLAGRNEAERKAVELFRALSLPSPEAIGRRYPHQVSGGQLQRLMAAMALITDPELVIFDEPTTALDVTTQVDVLKAFKSALTQSGATAIYVSHDLAVVAQMADRIAVLHLGKLKEEGPAARILEHPQDDYTRTLLAAARPQQHVRVPADDAPILEARSVTAHYGKAGDPRHAPPVLQNIALELSRGATLGIIGESGSGKSTLARVIAGLLPRSSGNLLLAGEELTPGLRGRDREQLRRIQLVFQNADTALNPAHTVAEIIARPLALFHGLTGAAAQARVHELLDMTRLPRTMASRPSTALSGGQKQRVNLARALAAKPDVLLCDEVTSALDTVVGAAILALIDELRRELGIATILISHDISTVRAFCDRILVLYGGTAVEQADQGAFAAGPHHPYTRLLMESVPAMEIGWLERSAGHGNKLRPAPADASLCRFFARCPVALPGHCDRIEPPVRIRGNQRWLCHHEPAGLAAQAEEVLI